MTRSNFAHPLALQGSASKSAKIWSRSAFVFWLCVAGTLFLPPLLKQALLGGNGSFLNPFYIVAFILCLKPRKLSETRVAEVSLLLGVGLLSVMALISNLDAGYSAYSCFKAFLTLNLPLVMLASWRSLGFCRDWMALALKIFDCIVIFLFTWAVVNVFTGGAVVGALANFAQGLVDYKNLGRLWTPYGHPLYNAAIFLVFFCFNTIASKKGDGVLPDWTVLIVSVVGLLLCASKSAFAIFLVLVLLWYVTNIKSGILVIFVGVALFAFGGFDLIVERFSQGLSSGRFETWELMSNMNILRPFGVWSGYGISSVFSMYESQLAWSSSAFEFPILGYSLSYGIAYTVILYLIIFLYPIVVLARAKEWSALVAFVAVGAHMNFYNGLYLVADYFAAFVFFTVVLLQLTRIGELGEPRADRRGVSR